MKSNEEEDDDHKGKVKKRPGDEMGPTISLRWREAILSPPT